MAVPPAYLRKGGSDRRLANPLVISTRVTRQDCRGEVGALKSDHSRRVIPLSSVMARRLWALGADQPDTARVCTSPEGFPISYGNLRGRVLVPATAAAGLEWVTFHTFPETVETAG